MLQHDDSTREWSTSASQSISADCPRLI